MRILFISPWAPFAHAVRCLAIAQVLKQRGIECHCIGRTGSNLVAEAEAGGFACKGVSFGIKPLSRWGLDLYTRVTVADDYHKIKSIIRDVAPSVIVSDGFPIIPLIAEEMCIPHAALACAAWLESYTGRRPILRFERWASKLGTGTIALNRWFQTRIFFRNCSAWARPLNGLAHAKGLRQRRSILGYMEGNDATLITDHPDFSIVTDAPETFSWCGPLSWRPPFRSLDLADKLNGKGPTLYLSFGSHGHADLLTWVIRKFTAAGWQVVLTTAFTDKQLRNSDLKGVYCADFVNVSDVLPHCSAAIFRGGTGTAYQLMAYHVPAIAVPINFEQAWHAQRMVDFGVAAMCIQDALLRQDPLKILAMLQGNAEKAFADQRIFSELEPMMVSAAELAADTIIAIA